MQRDRISYYTAGALEIEGCTGLGDGPGVDCSKKIEGLRFKCLLLGLKVFGFRGARLGA